MIKRWHVSLVTSATSQTCWSSHECIIRTKGTLLERKMNKLFDDSRFNADDELTMFQTFSFFFDELKFKGLRISASVHCTAGSTVVLTNCVI